LATLLTLSPSSRRVVAKDKQAGASLHERVSEKGYLLGNRVNRGSSEVPDLAKWHHGLLGKVG
jgi:hypothetical protein